jgi:hypothetical protein
VISILNYNKFIVFVDMADSAVSKGWRRVGRHYSLLLWKNVILAKRMPIRTLLEIILPVFFGFLLLTIRHIVKAETFTGDTVYPSFPINKLPPIDFVSTIGYAPKTSFTDAVMQRAASNLSLYSKLINHKVKLK